MFIFVIDISFRFLKKFFYLSLCLVSINIFAQGLNKGKQSFGVSISPSTVRFFLEPGDEKKQYITVTNNSSKDYTFKLSMYDFGMTSEGVGSHVKGGTGEFTIFNWMKVSPTFIELDPGESQKVTLDLKIPKSIDGHRAAWGYIAIEEVKERKTIEIPDSKRGKTMAFGILPTVAFGVYVYQTPIDKNEPNVDISDFYFKVADLVENDELILVVDNEGKGISFCKSYIQLINYDTGEEIMIGPNSFTILPKVQRNISFRIGRISPGRYSAVATIDFNSKTTIRAAEINFVIQ